MGVDRDQDGLSVRRVQRSEAPGDPPKFARATSPSRRPCSRPPTVAQTPGDAAFRADPLLTEQVQAIAQGPDGRVWLATTVGLQVYDGYEVALFAPATSYDRELIMRRLTAGLALAVALGFVACDSATSPEANSAAAVATPGVTTVEAALERNSQLGIERAEFRDGFCAVFFTDIVTLYTGASKAVTTNSGNVNYQCKGEVLFGPGPDFQVRLRDVTFFDFSPADGPWIIEPCDIGLTPGTAGKMQVSCHVGPRGGQAFNPDA